MVCSEPVTPDLIPEGPFPRYALLSGHGFVDLWEHPELRPPSSLCGNERRQRSLAVVRWDLDVPWSPAFYDAEDDEVYTTRMFVSEGKLVVETLSLSPLRDAHIYFDAYPALHDVIFEAQRLVGDGHASDSLPGMWGLFFGRIIDP